MRFLKYMTKDCMNRLDLVFLAIAVGLFEHSLAAGLVALFIGAIISVSARIFVRKHDASRAAVEEQLYEQFGAHLHCGRSPHDERSH